MASKSAADELGDLITRRKDFTQSLERLERIVTNAFLKMTTVAADAAVVPVNNLLRYADLLSNSSVPHHRELAYTTIALLREYDELVGLTEELAHRIDAVSEAVLVQLGNFPGILTLQKRGERAYVLPVSRGGLRLAKEVTNRTSQGDAVLTDAQFQITQRMHDEDFFSFAGPTSLGKSFILKDALYDIVRREELNGHCVVMLVPTKALIGQTANDLRKLLVKVPEVNVVTYPSLPLFLQRRYPRTIFVLTPERLLRYLSRPVRDIDYLVVDEAQKVVAENDTRSSLYYHAIVEAIRRFATKLIFATPSIKNPELFLELFDKSPHGALAVQERTVSQQRFFVDLVNRRQFHFSSLDHARRRIRGAPTAADAVDLVISLSGERKSIIYVNGSVKASEVARRLAQQLPPVDDEKVAALAKYVREYVHREYFLASTLEHGVAFHHGKMPQEIRERVEAAFADPDSSVQFVVCTSTLLEGVNLPAKNIFVLNDKHGNRHFTKLDFENLVGRAGRLTYDFSGNVVCVREENALWGETTQELIGRAEPDTAQSFLVRPNPRRRKEFTDIAHVLRGERIPGQPSADQIRSVQQYASILTLHQMDEQQTPLRSLFLDRVRDGREVLRKATASIRVPTEVLRRSPDILPEYQNRVWDELNSGGGPLFSLNNDLVDDQTQTFTRALQRLSYLYNWPVVEARGNDPLIHPNTRPENLESRLRYWAMLMGSWVRGDALSRVIGRSIRYYREQSEFRYQDWSRPDPWVIEPFDEKSARHINLVIEWTLRDLDGGLRFRIMSYLQNFYDLSVAALGRDGAGINGAALVEYGTTDPRAIQLQEVGFSRDVATELLGGYMSYLSFSDNGDLLQIDVENLTAEKLLSVDARHELTQILAKQSVN